LQLDIREGNIFRGDEVIVDKAEMLAYARTNDPQPFHVDEELAKHFPYGGLTASAGYTVTLWLRSRSSFVHLTAPGDEAHLMLLAPDRSLAWLLSHPPNWRLAGTYSINSTEAILRSRRNLFLRPRRSPTIAPLWQRAYDAVAGRQDPRRYADLKAFNEEMDAEKNREVIGKMGLGAIAGANGAHTCCSIRSRRWVGGAARKSERGRELHPRADTGDPSARPRGAVAASPQNSSRATPSHPQMKDAAFNEPEAMASLEPSIPA